MLQRLDSRLESLYIKQRLKQLRLLGTFPQSTTVTTPRFPHGWPPTQAISSDGSVQGGSSPPPENIYPSVQGKHLTTKDSEDDKKGLGNKKHLSDVVITMATNDGIESSQTL
jgi:hypothetical protein